MTAKSMRRGASGLTGLYESLASNGSRIALQGLDASRKALPRPFPALDLLARISQPLPRLARSAARPSKVERVQVLLRRVFHSDHHHTFQCRFHLPPLYFDPLLVSTHPLGRRRGSPTYDSTKWAAGSAIDSAARRHKALLSFDVPSSPSSRSIAANCVRQLSTSARPRSAHAQRPTSTDLRAIAGAGLLLPRLSFRSRNRRQAVSPFFLEAKPQTRARDSFGEGDASIAQAGARPIPRGARALNFRRGAGSDRGRLMTRSSLGSSSGALSRRDPRLSPSLRRSIDNILVKRSFPTATASIGAKEWRSEMLPTSSNDVSCRVTLVAPRTPSLPQLRRVLSPSEVSIVTPAFIISLRRTLKLLGSISNSNLKIVLQVNIYVFASPSRVLRTWTQFPVSRSRRLSSLSVSTPCRATALEIGKEGLERPCKGPKAFRGHSRASKGTQARDALTWPCEFEECLGRGAQALDVLVRPWDPSKGLPRPLEGLSAFGDVGTSDLSAYGMMN
ncbi:hypothetical protein FB451DRAFT_1366334 [Mycena latifolia]|nr:hypothetical protein FB451DRAFT_1366334 [Mycena latifolia]